MGIRKEKNIITFHIIPSQTLVKSSNSIMKTMRLHLKQ